MRVWSRVDPAKLRWNDRRGERDGLRLCTEYGANNPEKDGLKPTLAESRLRSIDSQWNGPSLFNYTNGVGWVHGCGRVFDGTQ